MEKWPSDRLTLALRLLVALPLHPTAPMEDTVCELGCARSTFYRLVADLRHAGFGIEKSYLPNGKASYFMTKNDRALLDRILRIKQAG